MILTVNVGNKNITLGGFQGEEMAFCSVLSTDTSLTVDEYIIKFKQILAYHIGDISQIQGVIIASVVPQLNNTLKSALDYVCSGNSLLVGAGIKTGIKLHCDDPASVGADIVCDCVAAHNLYGSPSIIVDVDTVIKIIAMDKNGAFEGLSIHPGLDMSLNALVNGSAQLPQVNLCCPHAVIGKNTADCIKSGIIYGAVCMINGMIDRFKQELDGEPAIIVTGKNAVSLFEHINRDGIYDEHLVLKGLKILLDKNTKKL